MPKLLLSPQVRDRILDDAEKRKVPTDVWRALTRFYDSHIEADAKIAEMRTRIAMARTALNGADGKGGMPSRENLKQARALLRAALRGEEK